MAHMDSRIKNTLQSFFESIKDASTRSKLLEIKGQFLGKNGLITELLAIIKDLPKEERSAFGKDVNQLKTKVFDALKQKLEALEGETRPSDLPDLSLPGVGNPRGSLHPITLVILEVSAIFKKMGFQVESGPEIETDFYNFEALNIPKHHPARDTQDTFFVDDTHVLRTQTSGIQIRTMQRQKPPIRIIAPGKVFRVDHDVTHSPVFHQIEGLMVDSNINFKHLKYVLRLLTQELFGLERKVRFRPSFFPFTEPSAEMDVSCFKCKGSGCRLCSQSGWIEILGCGMVDPNVFLAVDLDPDEVSGWAFGVGVERIAMLKYGITDIRLFYENDLRFLNQFR
jgi:phenylalanyl-tRNA synthetase alpha chain